MASTEHVLSEGLLPGPFLPCPANSVEDALFPEVVGRLVFPAHLGVSPLGGEMPLFLGVTVKLPLPGQSTDVCSLPLVHN